MIATTRLRRARSRSGNPSSSSIRSAGAKDSAKRHCSATHRGTPPSPPEPPRHSSSWNASRFSSLSPGTHRHASGSNRLPHNATTRRPASSGLMACAGWSLSCRSHTRMQRHTPPGRAGRKTVLRTSCAGRRDFPPQGDQGRLAPLCAELLPPLSPRGPAGRDRGHVHLAHRFPLHRSGMSERAAALALARSLMALRPVRPRRRGRTGQGYCRAIATRSRSSGEIRWSVSSAAPSTSICTHRTVPVNSLSRWP